MTARIGVLGALALALLAGLTGFWFSRSAPKAGPAGVEPSASRVSAPARQPDVEVAALVEPGPRVADPGPADGPRVKRAGNPWRPAGGKVQFIVRASDGSPILESLARWGLGQRPLTCVGTRRELAKRTFGSISAASWPYRFATVETSLVEGDQTATVLVTQRPSYLNLVFDGVVVASGRVDEETTEVVVHLSEPEARAALGGLTMCLVGGSLPPRGRAYLRAGTAKQYNAEPGDKGCLEFQNVAPGDYELSIYANRYASYFAKVRVEPSRTLSLGQITLQLPVPVAGTLTGDERFRANRLVAIQVLERGPSGLSSMELRQISTDSKGTFRIFDLGPGEYALRVVAPRTASTKSIGNWPLSRAVIVNTMGGPQMNVELPLEPTHGVVLRNAMSRNIKLDIRDGAGISVARVALGERGVRHLMMLPGAYELVATHNGEEVDRSLLRTPPVMTAVIGTREE